MKTIKLTAEDFTDTYGLRIFDNITESYSEFDFNEFPLSAKLKIEIKEWYNSYHPFTGMNQEELDNHSERINILDNEGIEILKKISKEIIGKIECKLTYYSRGKDKLIFETETD